MAAPIDSQRSKTSDAAALQIGGQRASRHLGLLAVVLVAISPIAEILRIVVGRPSVVLYGDQALIALAAERAGRMDQLLGPYSRAGFHHPGPAMFYLLAPFVGLGSSVSAGLYLGALAINLAALVASVAIVTWLLGPRAGLGTAVVIDLYTLCLGAGTLREPWNPYLVLAPMVLFLILWAAAYAGSQACSVWAFVVGSYEIQTHIATAPVVVVLLGVWSARRLARTHKAGSNAGGGRSGPRRVGLLALGLIWTPSVIEWIVDRPNNLQTMWDFFRSPHRAAQWQQVGRIAGDALTVVPFGNRDYVLNLHRSGLELAAGLLLLAGLTLLAARAARDAQQPFARGILIAAIVVAVLGTLSLKMSDGPVYLYFGLWLSVAPAGILISLVTALLGVRASEPERLVLDRNPAGLLAGTAVLGSALALVAAMSTGPISATIGSGPWPTADAGSTAGQERTVAVTALFDRAVLRALPDNARSAVIAIGGPSEWPYAAGIALALHQRGIRFAVTPTSWTLYFGANPGGTPAAQIGLYPSGTPGVLAGRFGSVVADVDATIVTYRPD